MLHCLVLVLTLTAYALAVAPPRWTVPFPAYSIKNLGNAVTAPTLPPATVTASERNSTTAAVPAVAVMTTSGIVILDAATGNQTHSFPAKNLPMRFLSPSVIGVRTHPWLYVARSTITGETVWSANTVQPSVLTSNDKITILQRRLVTYNKSMEFEIRGTDRDHVYRTVPANAPTMWLPWAVAGRSAAFAQYGSLWRQQPQPTTVTLFILNGGNATVAWTVRLPNVSAVASLVAGPVGDDEVMAYVVATTGSGKQSKSFLITRDGKMSVIPASASSNPMAATSLFVVSASAKSDSAVFVTGVDVKTRGVAWSKTIPFPAASTAKYFVFSGTVIVASYSQITAVDAATGAVLWTKAASVGHPQAAGPFTFAVRVDSNFDGSTVQIWSVKTGTVVAKSAPLDSFSASFSYLVDPTGSVAFIAQQPDSKVLLSAYSLQ